MKKPKPQYYLDSHLLEKKNIDKNIKDNMKYEKQNLIKRKFKSNLFD